MTTQHRYTIDVTGIKATATKTDEGFIVDAGSMASVAGTNIVSPTYRQMRHQLIAQGSLVPVPASAGIPEHLRFVDKVKFGNASAAATVVLGRQANGPATWKGVTPDAPAPRLRQTSPAKTMGRRMMVLAKQLRREEGSDEMAPWLDALVMLAADAVAGRPPINRQGEERATAAQTPPAGPTNDDQRTKYATACLVNDEESGARRIVMTVVQTDDIATAKGTAAIAALEHDGRRQTLAMVEAIRIAPQETTG